MKIAGRNSVWVYISLGIILLSWSKYNHLQKENTRLQDELSNYEDALQQANDNIEEVNSSIEDAQSNAWSNYQDMGDALDNLHTVETVAP